jgi:hypothetical protein
LHRNPPRYPPHLLDGNLVRLREGYAGRVLVTASRPVNGGAVKVKVARPCYVEEHLTP